MNRILELRKAEGLNQTELAKNIGIGQSTLSYWERGDYEPDNKSIIKIADFFNITTDYLLGRTDDPTPPNAKKEAPIHYEGFSDFELSHIKKYRCLNNANRQILGVTIDTMLETQEKESKKGEAM